LTTPAAPMWHEKLANDFSISRHPAKSQRNHTNFA
jgi:hypothetical protein